MKRRLSHAEPQYSVYGITSFFLFFFFFFLFFGMHSLCRAFWCSASFSALLKSWLHSKNWRSEQCCSVCARVPASVEHHDECSRHYKVQFFSNFRREVKKYLIKIRNKAGAFGCDVRSDWHMRLIFRLSRRRVCFVLFCSPYALCVRRTRGHHSGPWFQKRK